MADAAKNSRHLYNNLSIQMLRSPSRSLGQPPAVLSHDLQAMFYAKLCDQCFDCTMVFITASDLAGKVVTLRVLVSKP